MTTFFIDLWQDLREKRLWPVAVGLLAATVAIPLLMFKPTSTPPAQPAPPAAASGPRLPVVSVDNGPLEGSKLSQFGSPKNPFLPLSDLPKATSSSPTGASASGSGSAPSNPVSGTSSLMRATGTPGSGSGASNGSGSGSSSSGSSTTRSGPTTSSTPTRWFRYTVDVKFGAPGHLKTLKGLSNLAMLPNAKTPLLVFMGATADGAKAVFFIDDGGYTAHGRGTCNVSGDNCRFVTLTLAKNSETFDSVDGASSYKLELVKINRVFFTPKSTSGSTVKAAAAGSGQLANLDATQLVPALLSLVGAGSGRPQN